MYVLQRTARATCTHMTAKYPNYARDPNHVGKVNQVSKSCISCCACANRNHSIFTNQGHEHDCACARAAESEVVGRMTP